MNNIMLEQHSSGTTSGCFWQGLKIKQWLTLGPLVSMLQFFFDFFLTLSDMVNWKYQVMGFSNVIHIISYV
jgi:hypothetical protein